MSKAILDFSILKKIFFAFKVSYPLREYISSKKNDDYHRSFSSSKYSSVNTKNYSEVNLFFSLILFFFHFNEIFLRTNIRID
jgi:hypothetical protein